MAWITAAEVKTQITAITQREELESGTFWDDLIPMAVESATNEVKAKFRREGYTDDDAEGWFRAKEYSLDLSLWWALTRNAATRDYAQTHLKELDRREELWEMEDLVIEEPDPEDPDAGVIGGARSGKLSEDEDVFTMDMKL